MIEVGNIKLYDSKEVCAMLKISASTLNNMRKKGLLPYSKIANKCYISEEALTDYLRSSQTLVKAN